MRNVVPNVLVKVAVTSHPMPGDKHTSPHPPSSQTASSSHSSPCQRPPAIVMTPAMETERCPLLKKNGRAVCAPPCQGREALVHRGPSAGHTGLSRASNTSAFPSSPQAPTLIVHPRVLSARDPAPAQFLLLRTSLLASGRKSPSAGIQDGQEPGP